MKKIPSPETRAEPGRSADADVQPADGAMSRRTVLAGAALLGAGAVCLLSTRSSAQQKQKQADVQYVDKAPGADKCSGCAMFQAPDACQGVEGKISPEGWCNIYAPKA
jgi:hypothetical protein